MKINKIYLIIILIFNHKYDDFEISKRRSWSFYLLLSRNFMHTTKVTRLRNVNVSAQWTPHDGWCMWDRGAIRSRENLTSMVLPTYYKNPPCLKRTCFNIRWSVRPNQKTRRPKSAPRGSIGRTSRAGPLWVIGRRSYSYPRRFKL